MYLTSDPDANVSGEPSDEPNGRVPIGPSNPRPVFAVFTSIVSVP